MSNKKSGHGLSGKGYYIALVLCAVAIAIAGFFYYQNGETENPSLQQPAPSVQSGAEGENGVQAVATAPQEQVSSQTPPEEVSKKPSVIKNPVAGQTVAVFSMDTLSYNQTTRDWRVHDGMDIAAAAGTPVCAAADGTVYTVYEDETMGMTVVIRHEGDYTTKYASLSQEVSVKAGDKVSAGQVIGTVGTTALLESGIGDHLHFSVSCGGALVDPKAFLS